MIYHIEGRIAEDGEPWIAGGYKCSHRDRAEAHREAVQSAFDQYCRWKMETRVVETEGNILTP